LRLVSSPARTALEIRHAAAIKLVEAGELDGAPALSLVLWPRRDSRLDDENIPRGKQVYSDELRAEIRKRHAAGETIPALAQATGLPYATVKFWVSSAGRRKDAARLARRRGDRLLPDLLPNAVERADTTPQEDSRNDATKPLVKPTSSTQRHEASRAKRVSGSGSLGSSPSPAASESPLPKRVFAP
jgi:hypothetical protein